MAPARIAISTDDITTLAVDAIVNAANTSLLGGGGRGEAELLARCYRRVFELAVAHDISSLAFPAISCGVYGYPVDQAAEIAVAETRQVLAVRSSIEQVLFVCFQPPVRSAYEDALGRKAAR